MYHQCAPFVSAACLREFGGHVLACDSHTEVLLPLPPENQCPRCLTRLDFSMSRKSHTYSSLAKQNKNKIRQLLFQVRGSYLQDRHTKSSYEGEKKLVTCLKQAGRKSENMKSDSSDQTLPLYIIGLFLA